jgi:hypothetical protein
MPVAVLCGDNCDAGAISVNSPAAGLRRIGLLHCRRHVLPTLDSGWSEQEVSVN